MNTYFPCKHPALSLEALCSQGVRWEVRGFIYAQGEDVVNQRKEPIMQGACMHVCVRVCACVLGC